ncbi:unnamed protein product [Cunninghamella blakesleeana]
MGKKKNTSTSTSSITKNPSCKRHVCKSFKWIIGILLAGLLIQILMVEFQAAGATKTKEQWQALLKDHPYERQATDARSPCPMLNILANHGFLPRDGRNITKKQLFDALMLIGAPPMASQQFLMAAYFLYRNVQPNDPFYYNFLPAKTISLDQLLIHNVIEHDVSLTRHDIDLSPHDLVHPVPDLIQRIHDWALVKQNFNEDHQLIFTSKDEHDLRKIRWYESFTQNPKIHLSLFFQFSSSAECTLLMDIIGHDGVLRADHIETLLLHERFPEDWYPLEKSTRTLQSVVNIAKCWHGLRKSSADLKSLDQLKSLNQEKKED